MSEQIAVLNERGRIVETNAAWRQFALDNGGALGRTGVGCDYLAVCDNAGEPEASVVATAIRAMIEDSEATFALVYPCHSPDEERWVRVTASRFEQDRAPRIVMQHTLVSAQHRAEETSSLRGRLLDEAPAAVIGTDVDYCVTEWNRGAQELYGWTLAEVLGKNIRRLLVPAAGAAACDAALRSLTLGENWTGEMTLQRKDGSTFPAHVSDTIVLAADGGVVGYIGVSKDLTDQGNTAEHREAAQQHREATTSHTGQGLVTVDQAGRLLHMNAAAERMLGWRLEQSVGEPFAPIIEGLKAGVDLASEESPILRARRDADIVHVADALFTRADGTLLAVDYTASPFETVDGSNGSVVVFDEVTLRTGERDRSPRIAESLQWVGRIHAALAHDRFRLHAQPIIDLVSGVVVQHELLIRMLDAHGGLILPGAFLPAAERHGAVQQIDRWVVTEAAALAAAGNPIEINLSAESIIDPDMADFLHRAFASADADARNLVIELTETTILRDPDAGKTFLERVTALGCKVALDDFGTGYGAFTNLKNLPVDYIKIDVEFVRDLPHDTLSQHVVQAVVRLAAGTGKKTVAEGVENQETRDLLLTYGIDYGQGNFLGRPAPVDNSPGLKQGPRMDATGTRSGN